jgi:DNA-binding NtrC family response regulator
VNDSSPEVLVVDDDPMVRRAIRRTLVTQGYTVHVAENGEQAVGMLDDLDLDVALLDVRLPGMDGIEVLRRIKEVSPTTECVVITGNADVSTAHRSLEAGAADYFEKPIQDWVRFQQVLRRAAEVRQLRRETQRLRAQVDSRLSSVFGHSQAMAEVRHLVENVADSTASILITGESGVGKEVVAEELHRLSGRSGTYVKINCAALPGELLEAELFGYGKGAHSTATASKEGLLESGARGTVLLDEIGEMAFEMQAKLLRVLENNTFRRVGETRERKMTARILAATNSDLGKAIAAGRFREDLYHRLNVISVHVPPLRQRKEDVLMLAYRFVEGFNDLEGRGVRKLTGPVMGMLQDHHWPGNVRELRNVIHRAVLLTNGDELDAAAVQSALGRGRETPVHLARRAAGRAGPDVVDEVIRKPFAEAKAKVVERFTVQYLEYHLRMSGGNITRAAEASGMQRPNFKRLMRKYDVELPKAPDQ